MRRYLLLLLPLLVLTASPALAQKKGAGLQSFSAQPKTEETEEDAKAARRKAAGIQDLRSFGALREAPPKPFPWMGIGLAFLVMLALSPLGWKMYKSTRKDLEDQSTFGGKGKKDLAAAEAGEAPRISKRPPARALKASNSGGKGNETRVLTTAEAGLDEPEEGASSRDAVWDAISSSNGSWVTAEWVATTSGIAASETSEEIAALVQEGYLQEARDNKGKPVFRPS